MNKIFFEWKAKQLMPTRRALDEMFYTGIDMYNVIDILENGFDCARSRRRGWISEKCVQKGKKIVKVVVVDAGDYYKLIHVGKFSLTHKFKKMLKKKNGKN